MSSFANGGGGGWDVAQLVEHRTVTPLTQVRFPGAERDFSPGVNFQCRLSYVCVRTPSCTITCINVCAHVKDPVVHVRVRWIVQTLKHPACMSQQVFTGESYPNSSREKSHWNNTVVKKKNRDRKAWLRLIAEE